MPSAPEIKVLLVDDNSANLLALEAVLSTLGYTLVSATSGAQAVAFAEEQDFAVILLDVQMPGLDGYETARRIRAIPKERDVPIIFVTAVYREDEDARKGYAAGGLDYFPKPLDPDLLRTKVKLYSDLYQMTHVIREQSQLMTAVRELKSAERKLEIILNTISEAVIVADAGGKVVQANEEARRIWGPSGAGLPFEHPGDYSGVLETGEAVEPSQWPLARAIKTGEISNNELVDLERPEGIKTTIMISASPLRNEDDEIIGGVCVFQELRRTQRPQAPRRGSAKRRPRRGSVRASRP